LRIVKGWIRTMRGIRACYDIARHPGGARRHSVAGRRDHPLQGAQRLTRQLPVPNFRAVSFPLLETSASFEVKAAGAELNMDDAISFTAASALEPAALESRPAILRFSRQALFNDDLAALLLQSETIARAVRRAEVSTLCGVLENADDLSDSAAFWNTTDGSLIASGGAPTLTTLNEATNALWDLAEVPARYLVVPPELEHTARVLCASLSVVGEDAPLVPVVLPSLADAAAWYVFPDPAAAPAIGTMILAGSEDTFAVGPAMRIENSDDLGVRIVVDFKIVRLGRQAVKNPGA